MTQTVQSNPGDLTPEVRQIVENAADDMVAMTRELNARVTPDSDIERTTEDGYAALRDRLIAHFTSSATSPGGIAYADEVPATQLAESLRHERKHESPADPNVEPPAALEQARLRLAATRALDVLERALEDDGVARMAIPVLQQLLVSAEAAERADRDGAA